VEGWKPIKDEYSLILASLVLNKGESTDNGKLGITLVDLEPRIICSAPLAEPSPGKIKLKFYRPSDKQVLCETTIFAIGDTGGGRLDCSESTGLPATFSVRGINYKEGWVWIQLRTSLDDRKWQ
jgi:hypothetical protein